MKKVVLGILLVLMPFGAANAEFVIIENMKELQWQIDPDGKVWMRNFDAFHPNALGCCYNYYVDTTTAAGRTIWSTMLASIIAGSKLIIGVGTLSQPGPITHVGVW